jgi:hypothetical protein
MPDHPAAPVTTDLLTDDLGDDGSLVVEDTPFAIVPEWVITADLSDARSGNAASDRSAAEHPLRHDRERGVLDDQGTSVTQIVGSVSVFGVTEVQAG